MSREITYKYDKVWSNSMKQLRTTITKKYYYVYYNRLRGLVLHVWNGFQCGVLLMVAVVQAGIYVGGDI